MTKRIVIAGTPREKITVDLVGVEYVLSPLKGAIAMKMAKQSAEAQGDNEKLAAQFDDLVVTVFGPRQSKTINKRLNDPEDDLDIPDIMSLVQQLTEATTDAEVPTT